MHSADDLDDGYLGSGRRLRYSLNKYGKENHSREILEFCKTREELKSREEEIVNLNEIAKKECMNLKVGGEGRRPGESICDSTRKKISVANTGKRRSDSYKKHMSQMMKGNTNCKGNKLSDIHKQKIAKSVTGEKNGMYNKHHTDESIYKIRRSLGHTVHQYSLNGHFIKKWDSANEAYINLGIRCDSILGCCQKKYGYKTAGGYRWEYTKK